MKPTRNLSVQSETSNTRFANRINRALPRNAFSLALLMLGFLGISRTVAVTPPPDGGYPGGNTAEGQNSLLSLTTGGYNTALGFLSLRSNTTGQLNTAVGAATLLANTADSNTATGVGALLSNTTGHDNTADGTFALLNNINGFRNTAIGANALFNNSVGNGTFGSYNTAVGARALLGNINGSENTAIGDEALESNAEGPANTAVGSSCLSGNTTGDGNTAIGTAALFANTTGGNNTAVGYLAGQNVTTANNVICIGANVAGANVDESCYIGNIFGATSSNGVAVLVNSDGRLGTVTSSKRFKEDVKPIDKASEALFALKPVSFHYKQNIDPTCAAQFGLVAEDVEKVNPDLVIRDKQGKPYTVRYDQINSMLLNEFLKEHRTVLDLEKQIAILSTTVKEQGTQIERVSARLELSRSAAQTVSNHR